MDGLEECKSITICGFVKCEDESPFRIQIAPDIWKGINGKSSIIIDKIITVPENKIGKGVGRPLTSNMLRIDRAVFRFLGLAFPLDDGHS